MDCCHYITDLPERKSGQHLQREERGAIQALKRQGLSNRAIARELGCSPTTIGNELRRGTPPRKSSKGRAPGYSAKHGEAVYRSKHGMLIPRINGRFSKMFTSRLLTVKPLNRYRIL